MGVSAALLAVSAAGSLVQSFMAHQQGQAQAKVHKMNAIRARRAAQRNRELGRREAERIGQEYKRLRGQQIVSLAGSGISLTSPGAQDLFQQTARTAYQHQTDVREQAEWVAYDNMTLAANERAAASSARSRGTAGLLGGVVGAAGTVGKFGLEKGWFDGGDTFEQYPRNPGVPRPRMY